MGLYCSHNAWNSSYHGFNSWRDKVAELAGLPPLRLMEGWYPCLMKTVSVSENLEHLLPIKWECLKPSALHELLCHSDCDGEIPPDRCDAIADELEKLVPLFPSEWQAKTQRFVNGLRRAAKADEPLLFR